MDAHLPDRDRVLVVACGTAAGDALIEAVGRRAARSPCEFTLLVPRPCQGLHRVVDPEDHGWREAQAVLDLACCSPRPPAPRWRG